MGKIMGIPPNRIWTHENSLSPRKILGHNMVQLLQCEKGSQQNNTTINIARISESLSNRNLKTQKLSNRNLET
jgi:hypothetical protein